MVNHGRPTRPILGHFQHIQIRFPDVVLVGLVNGISRAYILPNQRPGIKHQVIDHVHIGKLEADGRGDAVGVGEEGEFAVARKLCIYRAKEFWGYGDFEVFALVKAGCRVFE